MGVLAFSLFSTLSHTQTITDEIITLSSSDNGQKVYIGHQEVHLKNGYQFSADANNNMHAYIDESIVLPTDYSSSYSDDDFDNLSINTNLMVGATLGSAGVSPSGAATYTIPIAMPKGTNGMQPNISVSYNSQSGNGILGYGWHIAGLSAITRAGKTHYHNGEVSPVSLTNEDRFLLDGQYLTPISGENGASYTVYATESESYAKIRSIHTHIDGPKYFKVEHKNGLVYEYGSNLNSRNRVVNHKALSWYLTRVTDQYNNYMTYFYSEDGQFRIEKIRYTANNSQNLEYHSELRFNYSERQDQSESYVAGNKIENTLILRNIETFTNGKLYRKYHFEHSFNTYSYLKSVTEQGAFGEQLNATKFKYENDESFGIDLEFIPGGGMLPDNREYFAGDFNGDGLQDLLCLRFNRNSNKSRCREWGVFINKNKGNTSGFQYHQMPLAGLLYADGKYRNVSEKYLNGVNILIGDLNGDSKDDIVVGAKGVYSSNGSSFHEDSVYYRGYLSTDNSNGYSFSSNGTSISLFDNSIHSHSAVLGDLDGDGRQEFISIDDFLFMRISSFDDRIFTFVDIENSMNGIGNLQVIDYNGDGKSELLHIIEDDGIINEFWIDVNLNHLFSDDAYTNDEADYILKSWSDENKLLTVGDFNGDGLADLLKKVDGQHKLYINKGLTVDQNFNYGMFDVMNVSNSMFSETDEMFYQDINMDGKTDIVRITLNKAVVELPGVDDVFNPGPASVKAYLAGGQPMSFNYVQSSIPASSISMQSIEFLKDFTGDGIPDVFGACNFDINASQNTCTQRMKAYELFDTDKPFLNTIKDGFNNEISFNYSKLTDYDNYSKTTNWGTYPRLSFAAPINVVSELSTSNGLGGFNSMDYTYKDAVLHKRGKGFLGFQKTSVQNQTTGGKTENYMAFHPTWHVPYPSLSKSYLNDELISESETDYYFNDLGNSTYSILPKTVISTNHLQGFTTVKDFVWSAEGNLEYEKTTVADGLDVKEGHYTYGQYGSHLKNVRMTAKITSKREGEAPFEVNTEYAYYSTGALKHRLDFAGMPKQVKTAYAYSPFGNINKKTTSATALSTHVERYHYDGTGRYLTKTINPLGHSITTEYHPRYGKPVSSTDALGKTTIYDYNAFGGLVKTTQPNGQIIEQKTEWDSNDDYLYRSKEILDGNTISTTWHDPLGRTVKNKVMGRNQSVWASQSYNAKGQITQKTMPHFQGGTALQSTYVYDDFGRIQTVNSPTGLTSYSYNYSNSQFKTTVISPQGTASSTQDASGKTIKREDEGGSVIFFYYSHGQQQAVTVNGQVVASMDYDGYARQRALHDANAGNTTYDYDAYGQLVSQTDAKNQTTTIAYDVLGRMTTKDSPEGQSLYSYYNSGGGKGQLKKAIAPNGNYEEYAYDSWGRLEELTEHIAGTDYTTEYHYDNKHQLKKTVYPTGFYVQNKYDNRGYLQSVKANGNQLIFTAIHENALGQYTKYEYANGMRVHKTYNHLGMPTNYSCAGIQDLSFDFDTQTGNLNKRSDHLKGLTEGFYYDDMNRLKQRHLYSLDVYFDLNNPYVINGLQNFNYFDNGNIKNKSDVSAQDYQYHPTKPHALVGVNNVVEPIASLQEQIIDYNSAQNPISITENNYELTFDYGVSQNRVQSVLKHNGQVQQSKTYLSTMEIVEGNGNTENIHYIPGGDGLAAIYVEKTGEEGQYYFVFTDYLGSILTLADKNGNVVQEQSFDAWGRYRNTEDWSYENVSPPTLADGYFTWLRGYTGHEYLPQFSLIHMNGRLYDPYLGRMLSPDNFVHTDFGTQGYNRYSYANNNPLKYTDPSGDIPILVPIAFAIVGAYIGGSTANGGKLNPLDWDYQSTDTWLGMGIGAAVGFAAGYGFMAGGEYLASTAFFSHFGTSGTIAAYTLSGTVTGAAVGYTSGFTGGMLFSDGNVEYSHQSGMFGLEIGSAAGSVIGLAVGLSEGYKPIFKAKLDDYKLIKQNNKTGCKEATCESIELLNGGIRTQDELRKIGDNYLLSNPNATPEEYFENFGFDVRDPSLWGGNQARSIGRAMQLGHPTVIFEKISDNMEHTLTIVKIKENYNGKVSVWFSDPERGRWKADWNSTVGNRNFNMGSYLFYLH